MTKQQAEIHRRPRIQSQPGGQQSRCWPDALTTPTAQDVASLLADFWRQLETLPALLLRGEHLLAAELTATLRQLVLRMMLALNGIQRPVHTRHLNTYLSEQQRAVLQKTLLAPNVSQDTWISQAVSLVVIYRWYAPQLIEAYTLAYPHQLETSVWQHLCQQLPTWPRSVTTEDA